ncbi:MAG: hypothetical protein AVDCRST_MAG02-3875 [uncultured Rubrobacteraceae bacterium]|uniref:HYR domain-containing protein n=1 Tax=uncultured Rubrobacteraceae bacterium TaxID=349277 RepID=A0A6J4RJJ6_9ACTN|nr:MAG: hypothetical protein AVDCRST_MAG02-3875 [uncultured Rubrobacteraceae bacterium]
MRTTLRSRLSLLFLSFAMVLAIPAVALADDVYNNLDNTIDVPAESITLTEGGTNDTASVLISPTNGDGKNGCNLTADKILQVKANSSDATKVKASLVDPLNSSLAKDTFTSCSDSIKIKVEALAVTGSTPVTISLSQVQNTTGATFNLAPATFTVTVNAAPVTNTKPALTLPANITKEATGPSGATVSYKATANDQQDGALTPDCKPVSGSTFPVGTTTVNCSVTDSGNLSDSGSFNVTVQDTTSPVLTLPSDITREATGPNGAAVNFTASANDAVDGNVNVNCTPDSGSQFALGSTTVTCNATDGSGNKAVATTFDVIVKDTTAPTLTVPSAPVVVEATGPNGAVATYQVTAEDAVDSSPSISCTPATGNVFALGTTPVTCTAKDGSGNTSAEKSFNVIVKDTTAPALNMPENKTAEATGPNGAAVSFARTASDLVDGNVAVNCLVGNTAVNPGDTFALGTTTVDCSATDRAGNKASDSFTVIVRDTTAPALKLPADFTEEATGPNGNVVNYSTSATDLVDGNVNVTCTPASGDTFGINTTATTVNCSATDKAGNTARGSFRVTVKDTIAPNNIQFVGGPADGASYDFGDVPAQPTCTAVDGGSGLDSCVVSGYSTAVGNHTLTATATDKAGNKDTKTLSYTVKPYTFNGFYQPVDMGGVYNTVKGGSTVPLKFELFKGATELTDTTAIKSLQATKVTCQSGATIDDIETVATGATSLRYDATGGQFIYNWKTPTGAGTCYKVTVTAQDGSTLSAFFKMK